MAKKTKESKLAENLLSGIDLLEQQGISREITIQALKESFESIVKKKAVEGLKEIEVIVNIVPENGIIEVFTIKEVLNDDDITDDAVEISVEDAQEYLPGAKVGDKVSIKNEITEFTKADAQKFKSILNQKIREAEKAAIYAVYADKVDELVIGHVEKVEPNTTLINFERTSVNLSNKEKIGDEQFNVGDAVKVYIEKVETGSESSIKISRACPGFLKRLFEEEVRDIYDGLVEIKGLVREAGERAKVAVSTKSLDIDPVGSCIGPAGQKIQKICQQINKEKIDVILYHEHKGLYIAEALKPASVLGVAINEETGATVAVVKDGDLKIAIGKKGVNARLAVRLTGTPIDIKEESQAAELGISYKTMEEMQREEASINLEKRKAEILEMAKDEVIAQKKEKLEAASRAAEEEFLDEEDEEYEEEFVEEEVAEEVQETKEEAPAQVETPVEEKVEEVEEKVEFNPVIMQSKVSLDDLEKQIESERKKQTQPTQTFKNEKKEEKVVKKEIKGLDIYTQDELEEMDEEEFDEYEEDNNYDEYDDDSYYEDN